MRVIIAMVSFALVVAVGAQAESGDAAGGDSKPAAKTRTAKFPVFVPRESGAPSARIGGATRGVSQIRIPSVDAFAPDQVGLTLEAQPSLFWYVSHATDQRVDFTLSSNGSTLVETTLTGPWKAGVQRIDLSDFDVSLDPGVTYVWYVSLIPDAERRSEDRIAGGAVERLADSSEIDAQIAAEAVESRVFAYAEHGIWYDAVRSATDRIDASAQGELARAQRAALLEQVGLVALAKLDRSDG